MRWLTLIFVMLLSGCQTYGYDFGCDVETNTAQGRGRGRGAIIGPNEVYTVYHVVEDAKDIYVEGYKAKIVSIQEPLDNGDGLVLLTVRGADFGSDRIVTVAPHISCGAIYLPRRGEEQWPWGLRPGDSGSPILDKKGQLIGLVRAVEGCATIIPDGMRPKTGK